MKTCHKISNDPIVEPNFLVLEPTQEEIKELDLKLIKMMKKIKLSPEERLIKEKENEKEYNKKYYASKKEQLESVDCDKCGGRYSYYSKYSHDRSKKHRLAVLENKNKI
jgi:hypothetical protein